MIFRKKKKTDSNVRRRNTGLPGSSNVNFNYHSSRSIDETNTGRSNRELQMNIEKKPIRTQWWKHLPTYIAILVVLGSLMYTLTLSTDPKVKLVDESSQTIVQPAYVYQQAAQNILQSSLSNKTKVTINTDKIASEIEQKYPEINGVTIIIPLLGHRPILEVRPAESIFVLSNPQGKYVINQQGNAVLSLTPSLASKYNLPVVIDQSGFHTTVGKEALPATSVQFIKTVIDQFGAKGMAIQSMTLSTNPYELDVQVRGEPYYIKFNLLTNPLYATGTYFATIKLFNTSNPAPTKYIDVRIPGRAYYQ